MLPIYVYDLIFLAIFGLAIAIFLYKNRKRVKIESKIIFMYRTKIGIKLMDWASKKFHGLLNVLGYFSIAFGYLMMLGAFVMFYFSIMLMSSLTTVTKVPPLMPLVPYLPQIFDLPLPPFYFSYWLIIILIVAVTHEFAHGVFARHAKLKVKSTGFGFFGPFLAAFVEPDERAMTKKSKKSQLAILSAGTFSNFIFAIIFILVLQLFLFGCYEKVGITGYMYALESVNITNIEEINGYSFEDFINLSHEDLTNITETLPVKVNDQMYYLKPELYSLLDSVKQGKTEIIYLYKDTPAIRANLSGALQEIDGEKINEIEDVSKILVSHKPNETIKIKTNEGEYSITLAEHPKNSSVGYLGIGFPKFSGFALAISTITSPFFSPYAYAEPKYNLEVLQFFRDLFFWLILICLSVALLNMLPLGILDGGKFLYVTALGLTGSKKKAETVFKLAAFVVLLIFLILMLFWFIKAF